MRAPAWRNVPAPPARLAKVDRVYNTGQAMQMSAEGRRPIGATRKLYRAGVIQLAVETHVTQCRRTDPMASPADASAPRGLPQVLGTPTSRTPATPSWPLTAAMNVTIARASDTHFKAVRSTGREVMRDGEQTRAARHEEAQGDTDQGQGSIAAFITMGAWLAVMHLRRRINTGTSGTSRMETPPAPCLQDRITRLTTREAWRLPETRDRRQTNRQHAV